MPDPIQLSQLDKLNLNDFKDQETGKLKNGSIKLGKSTYSVKFTDGKVSVSRNFHFFNLFRTNQQNELRDAFKAQMYNTTQCKNEALYTNTFNALEKNFKGDGVKSLMLFGTGIEGNTNKQGLEALEKFKQIQSPSETKEILPPDAEKWMGTKKNANQPIETNKSVYSNLLDDSNPFADSNESVDSNQPIESNKLLDSNQLVDSNKPVDSNTQKNFRTSKIESFIGLVGLNQFQLEKDLIGSLNRLRDKDFMNSRMNHSDSEVDSNLQASWIRFLNDENTNHADRVNIFKTLKEAILDSKRPQKKQLTGWAAMMGKHGVDKTLASFLQKNMQGDLKVTQKMVDCFKHFLENFNHKDSIITLNANLYRTARLNTQEQKIFFNCLVNAVHREVMKLGLEFCRENNIPVLFQWTDDQGKTVSSKELKNQLWSPDCAKDNRPKFAPILQTAMRHAQRMQNSPGMKLKLVQVNGQAPD